MPLACHEAGHAVAAWVLGIAPPAVALAPDGEHHQHRLDVAALALVGNDKRALRRQLENHAVIILAGPAAEQRADPAFAWQRTASDYSVAYDLLSRLAQGPDEADRRVAHVEAIARELIGVHWPRVEILAAKIIKHGRLDGTAAAAAIAGA